MALYLRLLRIEEPRISAHSFMAAMAEVRRGRATPNQFYTAFSLDTAEQAELAGLVDRLTAATNPLLIAELHDALLLAEARIAYTTETALKNRLGV